MVIDRRRQSAGTSACDRHGDEIRLAHALDRDDPVVVTDETPLRTACRALSVPVSDPVGVLIRPVECGDTGPEATERLLAMDRVGARLGASLLRRAERLIEEATED